MLARRKAVSTVAENGCINGVIRCRLGFIPDSRA
jgi:hypothetical protein